eukprot:1330864-Prymnesium_polylepis.1
MACQRRTVSDRPPHPSDETCCRGPWRRGRPARTAHDAGQGCTVALRTKGRSERRSPMAPHHRPSVSCAGGIESSAQAHVGQPELCSCASSDRCFEMG